MADAQPTGGYPVLGVVIEPDLPLAAQLLPGDWVHLAVISLEEAREARQRYEAWLRAGPEIDETVLLMRLAEFPGASVTEETLGG